MTKIFYDTEFLESGPDAPIQLISIGLVREDGAEYYAVSSEFDVEAVLEHDWLHANVWPYLPRVDAAPGERFRAAGRYWPTWLNLNHPDVKPRGQIRDEIRDFVLSKPNPELWAYYGAYDHVALCQLFGRMIDLPDGFPMWTADLKQLMRQHGIAREDLPEQGANLHKAIDDARWVRDAFNVIGELTA